MYCSKCGKEIVDEAVVCINCGCAVAKNDLNGNNNEDVANAGLNILGFLIPLAGLIIYCTTVGKTPKKANQIGLFSLIGFVVNLFFVILAMTL